MSDWRAATGRITFFRPVQSSPPPPSAIDIFRLIWNREPENFQNSPNPLAPSVAQGVHGAIMVNCATHPVRIDFNLTPHSPSQETHQTTFPLFEDVSAVYSELDRIIGEIETTSILGSINRVALSVQFLAVKENVIEANKILVASMPEEYGVRLTDEEDVIFQVNRPSMVPDLDESSRVNKIIKWSVARLQVVVITFMSPGQLSASGSSPSAIPNTRDFIAADVTFDINSAIVSPQLLTQQQQASILRAALKTTMELQNTLGLTK